MVATNGNTSVVGISLFRSDKVEHFEIGDPCGGRAEYSRSE